MGVLRVILLFVVFPNTVNLKPLWALNPNTSNPELSKPLNPKPRAISPSIPRQVFSTEFDEKYLAEDSLAECSRV